MTYDELYKKYIALLKENELYRRKFGPIESTGDKNNDDNVRAFQRVEFDKYSTPDEKIELFSSLFFGRQDVYARRWEGKNGKSGYSPVCKNEWKSNICRKPKTKCVNCEYRDFAGITKDVIRNHLTGKEVIGIYPMLEDETCRLLVIDFDGQNWDKDIKALRLTCGEKSISAAFERSRSGNGAHVWFFFENNIVSNKVRKFGAMLITYTMGTRHEISFSSYDRLFPNQDNMPKGGLGNLIALPLQKEAREHGNSVFIDENNVAYEDQWEFIAGIQKISDNKLNSIIDELSKFKELGELEDYGDEEKPWAKTQQTVLNIYDFPSKVTIVKAKMLYIQKSGISSKGLNKIKRLAAFKNPDFYRTQAMRLPVYNKPRVISLAEENDEYLFIPRGCEEKLMDFLSGLGVKVKCIDERNEGKTIDVEFKGNLSKLQSEATKTLLRYDNGILEAATAFGKTVVGISLIAEIKRNTLIIVHSKQLLLQWKERIEQFLVINEELPNDDTESRKKKKQSKIGQIGGGIQSPLNIIDIALVQSLITDGEVKEIVRNYGLVIVDECHHAASYTYEKILKTVMAKRVYGLTATPIRRDGQHPITFMCCGSIRYTVDAQSHINSSEFCHYVIPRFTRTKEPQKLGSDSELSINDIFASIVISQLRNNQIVKDILESYQNGRNILVLTDRIEHVELLYDMVRNHIKHAFVLSGKLKKSDSIIIRKALDELPENENVLIIATSKYIGEGFDYPRLDTLLLTFPFSWRGRLQQYAGRLHREYTGKKDVLILDYVDVNISVLEKMYHKRLKGYASIGYKIKGDISDSENTGLIFNEENFISEFSKDISNATQEIIISSPFITMRKTSKILDLLEKNFNNNADIFIFTKPANEYKEVERPKIQKIHELISNSKVHLILKPGIYKKFALIDKSIVWFGSINILGYGQTHESIIRFFNREVGAELND